MEFEVDGRRAYGYCANRPLMRDQPSVVFVHGAQHDHSVWGLQSRYLAHHGWNVLALDLPGHGRSEGPALATIEAMATWVLKAIEAAEVLDARPLLIAGHSMGSLVALEAAGQCPERVDGIALVATAFPMKVSDALLEAARTDEARAIDMINYWSHSGPSHRPGAPGPGFSVFVGNRRLMERQAPGVLFNDFNACNSYRRGLERAGSLACPALYVLGERDAMTMARHAKDLIRQTPRADVVEIPGSGHNLMGEQPERTLNALRGWLDARRAEACARSA